MEKLSADAVSVTLAMPSLPFPDEGRRGSRRRPPICRSPYIRSFLPAVDALAQTFGPYCEVVLHDFSNPRHSIVRIANGHVTGRQVGDPVTDLGLKALEHSETHPYLANYRSVTATGRDIKSTSIFIRDSGGRLVGMLCVNLDTSLLMAVRNVMGALCFTEDGQASMPSERLERDIGRLAQQVLAEVLREFAKPPRLMDRMEKLEVVRRLCDRGILSIKGAVVQLAEALHLAVPTVYKYADRARRASGRGGRGAISGQPAQARRVPVEPRGARSGRTP